jgi:catechol 2,3-dioxygenase-like lactoylglutathione lyase family enzyme
MTLSKPPAGFLGDRVQLAFVVRDLDAAMAYWTETLRVGPFVVIENARGGRDVIHRGAVTPLEFTLAFAYQGDVQIELIHQSNDAPSSYKEFLDSGREGLHHLAYWPENIDAACTHLEANGFTEVTRVLAADGSRAVAYYESPAEIGPVVEILPMSADRIAYYGRIQRLSQSWDGATRPVRRYADRAAFLASGEGAEG